jgi:hypothetical protein
MSDRQAIRQFTPGEISWMLEHGDQKPSPYTDLRDAHGHLLARLDPERWLLEIQKRGEKTLFDLRALLAPHDPESAEAVEGMAVKYWTRD